ncbi:MAG: beta-xylosidase [Acidobacteriaceae bacterium]|nr:beta-xylosidase [Acidobacteriaceae bacterium]
MIEAVMLWNEPNNLSHWDFEIDRDWSVFADMVKLASAAIRAENAKLPKVLGGISPIDPAFIVRMHDLGALGQLDVVAIHGFPLDWNHWTIHEWPAKVGEIQAVTEKPLWVSEVGASSFGAEEVQEFGLHKTAELLLPRLDHVYWYSLFDLPRAWPATTRHRESEGSSYYRHFYMGLYREDGTAKLAARQFACYAPALGICQWFHFDDHRLERAVQCLQDLGVRKVRTGLSWADYGRPNAEQWFDHQMKLLEPFDVTVTFCFTPEHCGMRPHYTSPPKEPQAYAEFCAKMIRRYAGC